MQTGTPRFGGAALRALWASLTWRCLPAGMKHRLLYAMCLESDLFVPLPVPTKRRFIHQAQSVLGYPTFVETGTYEGAMARYASGLFQMVHSIELDPALAQKAARELTVLPNVRVHQGDSGRVLPDLLAGTQTPCLFWLDGHYSGGKTAQAETDTPIVAELQAIAAHPVRPHAILIDDARSFGTDNAYPTIERVAGLLRQIDPSFRIGVSSDIIWAARTKLLHFEWRALPAGEVVRRGTAPVLAGKGSGPAARGS